MRMRPETKNDYGAEMCGRPLDGEKLKVIPFNMLDDLQTILCYDYEDGKPWHDMTCVMELIFNNFHDEINNSKVKKIRYLYDHPHSPFLVIFLRLCSMCMIPWSQSGYAG